MDQQSCVELGRLVQLHEGPVDQKVHNGVQKETGNGNMDGLKPSFGPVVLEHGAEVGAGVEEGPVHGDVDVSFRDEGEVRAQGGSEGRSVLELALYVAGHMGMVDLKGLLALLPEVIDELMVSGDHLVLEQGSDRVLAKLDGDLELALEFGDIEGFCEFLDMDAVFNGEGFHIAATVDELEESEEGVFGDVGKFEGA